MIKFNKSQDSESTSHMQIDRLKPLKANVGIMGVGHYNYWSQFEGLLDKLNEKLQIFCEKVQSHEVKTSIIGISDCAETAYQIASEIKSADLDLLFIDMLTYATSSAIAAIFREVDVPIVLVALQPQRALEYDHATTFMQLYNDDICAIPEFTSVARRMGRPVPQVVIGTLNDDEEANNEIGEYCRIAKVLHSLRTARIGQMGHVLESMLDMHTDPTLLTAAFGCHIVQTEPGDVVTYYHKADVREVEQYSNIILQFFDTPEPKSDPLTSRLSQEDLENAARVGVALNKFIESKKLDGLAYYYEGQEGSEIRKVVSNFIVCNSILTAGGFPMCGEMDLKTCIAMMIMDRLDMGGSFAEFHPIDFNEGFVLIGHDGPHHINIAEGKPVIRSLSKYHGKPGNGASVEFKIKEGPITMLGMTQKADGSFRFIIAEGESKSGPIPATGNTNTRGFFKPDARTFLKRWFAEGPTHHFALGIGHKAEIIKKVGDFLGIESVIIEQI